MSRRIVLSLQLICLTLFGALARATTLARLSLENLAASADSVARLRCADAQAHWENGSIWTVTQFDVLETMKGNLPSQISVRLPGGRVGHVTTAVDGAPRFAAGEEAILFLERSRAGNLTVTGWVEGSFRISRDPVTRAETVTQDSSSFAVFEATTRTFRAEGIRRMPIARFRARLNAALARTSAIKEKTR